jgi:hypothetical protein
MNRSRRAPKPHGLEQIRRGAERPQLWSPCRRMERTHEGDLDRGCRCSVSGRYPTGQRGIASRHPQSSQPPGGYWWVECGTCGAGWQVPHYAESIVLTTNSVADIEVPHHLTGPPRFRTSRPPPRRSRRVGSLSVEVAWAGSLGLVCLQR